MEIERKMIMKKRIFALLCTGMMLLSGCGGGNGGNSGVETSIDFKGYPMEFTFSHNA